MADGLVWHVDITWSLEHSFWNRIERTERAWSSGVRTAIHYCIDDLNTLRDWLYYKQYHFLSVALKIRATVLYASRLFRNLQGAHFVCNLALDISYLN